MCLGMHGWRWWMALLGAWLLFFAVGPNAWDWGIAFARHRLVGMNSFPLAFQTFLALSHHLLFSFSSQDDFAHLRPLCYPQVDVALICYSVVDHASFDSVKSKWMREVHRHCPGVPIILVGTQTDQRVDTTVIKRLKSQGKKPLTKADGNKLASQCKAACYLECSALTQQNVKQTFDEAIATGLEMNNGSSKHTPQCAGCTIL